MKTELLVVKCAEGYLRFTDSGFEVCEMNKASVYPLKSTDEVRAKVTALAQAGIPNVMKAEIFILTILEEKFTG